MDMQILNPDGSFDGVASVDVSEYRPVNFPAIIRRIDIRLTLEGRTISLALVDGAARALARDFLGLTGGKS